MNKIIPNSWEEKKFGEIGKLQGGFAFKSSKFKKKGIPIIRISNLNNGKVDLENLVYNDHVDKLNNFLIKKNDILIAMSGATTGKIGIYQSNRSAYLNQRVGRFLIQKNELLNLGFLAKIVQQDFFLKKLLVDAIGGAQPNISSNQIEDLSIKIPPLAEQKKIASILTSVDEVIEKTQSQINKLQDLKKGTMNELLTRGIGHIEFKDSELGKIPKGWEISDLKSLVVSHNSGIYKKKSEYGNGYNILGVSDLYSCHIVDGQIFRKVPLTDEEVLEFSLKKGDLVYGESSLVREGIAKTVCVSENGEGTIFAWHTRRFSVSDNMDSIFLNYFLSSNISRTYLTKVATQTALTGITTKDYFGVKVVIPSFKEQQQIVTILSSIDNHIEKKQRKLQKNQYLKKSLMQDLLTGKVRVSVN